MNYSRRRKEENCPSLAETPKHQRELIDAGALLQTENSRFVPEQTDLIGI